MGIPKQNVVGIIKLALGVGFTTTGITYSAFELLHPSGDGLVAKSRIVSLPEAVYIKFFGVGPLAGLKKYSCFPFTMGVLSGMGVRGPILVLGEIFELLPKSQVIEVGT